MTDLQTMLDNIRRSIQADAASSNDLILLNSDDPDVIITYDNACDKFINYTLRPLTEQDILGKTHVMPDVPSDWLDLIGGPREIAKQTLSLDPAMLVTLNHIIVTTESKTDYEAIAKLADCDDWEVCEFDGSLGMYWYSQTSVVINMTAIKETAHDITEDLSLSKRGELEEFVIGFYSTLFHELRHLGLDCPYLPEDLYPQELTSEQAVEDWCRSTTDAILYNLEQLAADFQTKTNKKED